MAEMKGQTVAKRGYLFLFLNGPQAKRRRAVCFLPFSPLALSEPRDVHAAMAHSRQAGLNSSRRHHNVDIAMV